MDEVDAVDDSDLREATGTPGIRRRVAFEDDGYWFGHVEAEADKLSGWHHHGDNVTLGYVLEGRVTLEFGPGGQDSQEVEAGQYFTVPAQAVHREGNLSDEPTEIILVRVGEGPPVVPVEGPTSA